MHSQGKAQFMLLTGVNNAWSYEFVSLDYDSEKVISDLFTSGLSEKAPYWCKVSQHLLRTGESSHGSVLTRAMSLCQQDIGQCKWPKVPEQYWEKAINELIDG